jgi:hypothetical protein
MVAARGGAAAVLGFEVTAARGMSGGGSFLGFCGGSGNFRVLRWRLEVGTAATVLGFCGGGSGSR